jgi:quercetin dioxygenase-like cupin family protein
MSNFQHSFGMRTVVEVSNGSVEIIRFDKSGKSHSHEVQEFANCISGKGWIVFGSVKIPYEKGDRVEIPADIPHHMEPDPEHGPYEWVIWYDG